MPLALAIVLFFLAAAQGSRGNRCVPKTKETSMVKQYHQQTPMCYLIFKKPVWNVPSICLEQTSFRNRFQSYLHMFWQTFFGAMNAISMIFPSVLKQWPFVNGPVDDSSGVPASSAHATDDFFHKKGILKLAVVMIFQWNNFLMLSHFQANPTIYPGLSKFGCCLSWQLGSGRPNGGLSST